MAEHLGTEFILKYSVSAPNVSVPYSSGKYCVPTVAEVHIAVHDEGLRASLIVVKGVYAKKDGTPGVRPCELRFWLSQGWAGPPPEYFVRLAAQAVETVDGWRP